LESLGGESKTKETAGTGCAFLADKFASKLAASSSMLHYANDPSNKGRTVPVFCAKDGSVGFRGGTTPDQATTMTCAELHGAYNAANYQSDFTQGVFWSKASDGMVGPMHCSLPGISWIQLNGGVGPNAPFIGSVSVGCANLYATFNKHVQVASQFYFFAAKKGAEVEKVLCKIEGNTMKAVNDGKSKEKPVKSCAEAYALMPDLVASRTPIDNEFYVKTSSTGATLYGCVFHNDKLTATQLEAGKGTAAEPYTLDCKLAAPLLDTRLVRAPASHYAQIKLPSQSKAVIKMCSYNAGKREYETFGTNTEKANALTGTCHSMVEAGAAGVLANGKYWFQSTTTKYTGKVAFESYCDLNSVKGKGFVLIGKFSKNNFCYYSGNWHKNEYNVGKSMDSSMPGSRSYDTLNMAYGRMAVSGLYFTGHKANDLKKAGYMGFSYAAAPRLLMTSQSVPIKDYPNWNLWQKHFGGGRQWGPQFMRNARWELASKSYKDGASQRCRSQGQGSTRRPSGCGQKCVFCFQAGDGNCCHSGCGHRANDVSFGLGLSSSYCGGGDGGDCSASGNWADSNNRVIVWGGV
jgi:hypothetical protein